MRARKRCATGLTQEKPVKVDDVVKSPRKAGRGEDVEMQKLLGLANGHRKSGAGT